MQQGPGSTKARRSAWLGSSIPELRVASKQRSKGSAEGFLDSGRSPPPLLRELSQRIRNARSTRLQSSVTQQLRNKRVPETWDAQRGTFTGLHKLLHSLCTATRQNRARAQNLTPRDSPDMSRQHGLALPPPAVTRLWTPRPCHWSPLSKQVVQAVSRLAAAGSFQEPVLLPLSPGSLRASETWETSEPPSRS